MPAVQTALRFLLNDEDIVLDALPATMMLLDYLRLEKRLRGSKEGCAEGDCGACTVVIGELQGDTLAMKAVNSCIQFLPTLDGRALFTVEDLKQPDDTLHPMQNAFMEHHGLQCGFCTPGFLMLAVGVLEREPNISDEDLLDVLSSNLCRCTGYRNIIKAVRAAAIEMRRS